MRSLGFPETLSLLLTALKFDILMHSEKTKLKQEFQTTEEKISKCVLTEDDGGSLPAANTRLPVGKG